MVFRCSVFGIVKTLQRKTRVPCAFLMEPPRRPIKFKAVWCYTFTMKTTEKREKKNLLFTSGIIYAWLKIHKNNISLYPEIDCLMNRILILWRGENGDAASVPHHDEAPPQCGKRSSCSFRVWFLSLLRPAAVVPPSHISGLGLCGRRICSTQAKVNRCRRSPAAGRDETRNPPASLCIKSQIQTKTFGQNAAHLHWSSD